VSRLFLSFYQQCGCKEYHPPRSEADNKECRGKAVVQKTKTRTKQTSAHKKAAGTFANAADASSCLGYGK